MDRERRRCSGRSRDWTCRRAAKFGSAVDREPAARRLVSIAFQSPVFLRGSVRQNLDLALRLRDIAGPERRVRIEEGAAECGVTRLLERPASQLSGGEAQRVNLA